jgi:hypothetical protein
VGIKCPQAEKGRNKLVSSGGCHHGGYQKPEGYTHATVQRDYPVHELRIIHKIALAGPGPKLNGPQILRKLTRPPQDFPQDLHVKILWRVWLDLGIWPGTSQDLHKIFPRTFMSKSCGGSVLILGFGWELHVMLDPQPEKIKVLRA